MAIPTNVQQALDRLDGGYNNSNYNASTNPLGFGNGGHRLNLPALSADVTLVGDWFNTLVSPIAGKADEVAIVADDIAAVLAAAANMAAILAAPDAASAALAAAGSALARATDAGLARDAAAAAAQSVVSVAFKTPVRVATTVAGTLASSFENGDTVDGVVLATGDRILIKNQASAAQNGIYVVAASGAPSRASDADADTELVHAAVLVNAGTVNIGTQWQCTTLLPITVGTTGLVFTQIDQPLTPATAAEMIAGNDPIRPATAATTKAAMDDRLGGLRAVDLPPESGWLYALVDSLARLGFGIDTSGRVFLVLRDDAQVPRAALAQEVRDGLLQGLASGVILADESGWRFVLEDISHNIAFGIKPDGTFWAKFAEDVIFPASYTASIIAASRASMLPTSEIVSWGDSLTAGSGGGGTSYPGVLATELGRTVTNKGIGGQTSDQIAARQGGMPILCTVTGNTIPASGGVAVTAKSVNILTSSGTFSGTSLGTIAGVRGTVSTDVSGNWAFTRATSGATVACAPNTPFIPDDVATYADKIVLIQMGQNNTKTTRANIVALRDDALSMLAVLTPSTKRFLVMAITGSALAPSGSAGYLQTKAGNDELKVIFGDRFVDHRRYLIDFGLADAGITPTTQDLADIANDVIPESLRAPGDPIHLNATGYTLVAKFMARQIKARGW